MLIEPLCGDFCSLTSEFLIVVLQRVPMFFHCRSESADSVTKPYTITHVAGRRKILVDSFATNCLQIRDIHWQKFGNRDLVSQL